MQKRWGIIKSLQLLNRIQSNPVIPSIRWRAVHGLNGKNHRGTVCVRDTATLNLSSSHFSRRGQGNLYLRTIHSQVTISTFLYLSWFLRIFPLDFAFHGITLSWVIMRIGIQADARTAPFSKSVQYFFQYVHPFWRVLSTVSSNAISVFLVSSLEICV